MACRVLSCLVLSCLVLSYLRLALPCHVFVFVFVLSCSIGEASQLWQKFTKRELLSLGAVDADVKGAHKSLTLTLTPNPNPNLTLTLALTPNP